MPLRSLGLWCLIVLASLLLSSPAWGGVTAGQALDELNAWRAEAGLRPVATMDPRMSEGCRQHNAYEAANHQLTHTESPSKPGFTYLGAAAGENSDIAAVEGGPRYFAPYVYHRILLLDPRLSVSWFDTSNGFLCVGNDDAPGESRAVFGDGTSLSLPPSDSAAIRTPRVAAYPWPPNEATGVPTVFLGGERPDPAEAVPGHPARLGYLLSVEFNGPWQSGVGAKLTQATLTPDGGGPVPVAPEDHGAALGDFMFGAVGIFPAEPLKAGTWYTARAVGTKEGVLGAMTLSYPFDVTWRFQTAPGSESASGSRRAPAVRLPDHVDYARGRLITVIACPQGGPRCAGTLSIAAAHPFAARRSARSRLGSTRFTVSAGRSAGIAVVVPRGLRRRVGRILRRGTVLTARTSTPGGRETVVSGRARLR